MNLIFIYAIVIIIIFLFYINYFTAWITHYKDMYKHGSGVLCGDWKLAIKEFDKLKDWSYNTLYHNNNYGYSIFPQDQSNQFEIFDREQIHANIFSFNNINFRLKLYGYFKFCNHVKKNNNKFPKDKFYYIKNGEKE